MKYIIDLDALKECLNLLPKPIRNGNLEYVCLQAVKEMIDKFPKEDYKQNIAMKKLSSDELKEKYCPICPDWCGKYHDYSKCKNKKCVCVEELL